MSRRRKIAKRGEFWSINDGKTRGHKSFIVRGNKYRNYILHLPITHSNKTKRMNNKRLLINPEFGINDKCYILPKVQKSHERFLGKKQNNMQIKNTNDKALVRNIIKRHKKR